MGSAVVALFFPPDVPRREGPGRSRRRPCCMSHDCFILFYSIAAASHCFFPRPSASVRTEPVPAAVGGTVTARLHGVPVGSHSKSKPPTALVRRVSALIDCLRGLLLCFRSDGALGQTLPVMQHGAFDLVARAVHCTTGIPRVARCSKPKRSKV